jgi:uncharacterized protein (TIGR02145 family)
MKYGDRFRRIINERVFLLVFISIALALFVISSCEKPVRLIKIDTIQFLDSDISYTSALLKGDISDLGSAPIDDHGIFVSENTVPAESNSEYQPLGTPSKKGEFEYLYNDLKKNTRYYYRAVAFVNSLPNYGKIITFKTKDIQVPTVKAGTVTAISMSTATLDGEVTSDGGESSTTRGLCWGISANPTISNCIDTTLNGSGKGVFTGELTGLTANTQYYVKAYAINSKGTSYNSADLVFNTHDLPKVTTTDISGISNTGAQSGGNVTDDGNVEVTARGVCWGTSAAPEVASINKTSDGSGKGTFTSTIADLTPMRTYYLRAYATNRYGTSYGNELSFSTSIPASASTTAASSVTTTNAVLNGNVNPNNISTTVSFEYGTTTSYGSEVPAIQNPVSGTNIVNVTSALGGLIPGTLYHYRIKADNAAGTILGSDIAFTTLKLPEVAVGTATGITVSGGILNGTVNANNSTTIALFEYGPTATYGSEIIASQSPVSGNTITTVSAMISGFTPTSVIHFRIKATSSAGTVYSNDQTLTTIATPIAITDAATSVTATAAILNGTVNANYSLTTVIFDYGITSSFGSVITASQSPVSGSVLTTVSAALSGLTAGTLYHYKVKTENAAGITEGSDITFTTGPAVSLPTVTTTAISTITTTTAATSANVTSDGGASVSSRGVCWSTLLNPTVTDSKTDDGAGIGSFTSSITGLTSGTSYHVRAYAINSAGTGYGSDVLFSTLGVPTVTTTAIYSTASSSAMSGGNVISSGGVTVISKGVCWSLNANPTTADPLTIDGSGMGSFTSSLSGLSPNTTYYLRTYATNSIGTGYGNQVTFTTTPQVTDYDGNIYTTITIGTQLWMQENMKTAHFRDGTPIANVISGTLVTAAYSWIGNDIITKDPYGALYNYYAAVDNHNLCPTGWHVPTNNEWTLLNTFLGGNSMAGGKLKESGTVHWGSPNTGATNESWFTALPAGHRMGSFGTAIGTENFLWSSTIANSTTAKVWGLDRTSSSFNETTFGLTDGISVRCLQGEGLVLPSVTTNAVSDIKATAATAGGYVNSNGGSAITARGVCWSTSPNPNVTGSHTTDGTLTGSFSSSIIGLTVGTTYYVRAYATNSVGTAYGDEVSFLSIYAMGDYYQGGVIFSVSGTYPNQHGLICAQADQSSGTVWGCDGSIIAGADGTALGTGNQNTIDIVSGCSTVGIAARICYDLNLNGYTDWYLPSVDELTLLVTKYRETLSSDYGGAYYYWSSTEDPGFPATLAVYYNFWTGVSVATSKTQLAHVRAIRTF